MLFCRMLAVVALLVVGAGGEPEAAVRSPGFPPDPSHYCSNGGYCVPNVLCSTHYMETLYDPAAACYLAHGTPGVCCPPKKASCEFHG